ncbi:MAG: hypothetical protein RIC95_13685 [Vicingaceae bacterium]
MKNKFKHQLRVILFLPFLILGLGWMFSYPVNSLLFAVAVSLLPLGALAVSRIGKSGTNMMLLLSFTLYAYLFGEVVVYFNSPYLNTSGFNKKSTKFDPVRGYRWLDEDIRYFKNRMGEMVFDNHFHPNNKGWIMKQDYSFKKRDSTAKRWMILGDSFVAGLMLETNLPDRMQELIIDSVGKGKIELYSFGVDGGGIMNWYNILFKEIIPNYEFDGVIIAPYADNLYRDFMVMLIDHYGYMGRIDSVDFSDKPIDVSAFKAIKPFNNVYTDEKIDYFKTQPFQPFDWPFKRKVNTFFKNLKHQNKTDNPKSVTTIEQLKRKMGDKRFTQLDSMISWCKSNQKGLILASIPSIWELKGLQEGTESTHQTEMDILAEAYELNYFDGYQVFDELSEKALLNHWLHYDGHWNQKGSDKYAEDFSKYLIDHYAK